MARLVLLFLSSILCLMLPDAAQSGDKLLISIPADKITGAIQKRDRISEYKVQTSSGRVYSVTKISQDWMVTVDDRVGTPALKAFGHHGASFLTYDDVKKGSFKDFLVIETRPPDWGPFDIKIDLTIDVFMKEQEKHILIEKKDIVITPVQ